MLHDWSSCVFPTMGQERSSCLDRDEGISKQGWVTWIGRTVTSNVCTVSTEGASVPSLAAVAAACARSAPGMGFLYHRPSRALQLEPVCIPPQLLHFFFFVLRGAFENGIKKKACHKIIIFEKCVFTVVFKCLLLRVNSVFKVIVGSYCPI